MIRMESFPRIIRSTVGLLWATIINILASRVYRNTKSGLYLELVDGPNLPTIRFTESAQGSVTMGVSGTAAQCCVGGLGREKSDNLQDSANFTEAANKMAPNRREALLSQ